MRAETRSNSIPVVTKQQAEVVLNFFVPTHHARHDHQLGADRIRDILRRFAWAIRFDQHELRARLLHARYQRVDVRWRWFNARLRFNLPDNLQPKPRREVIVGLVIRDDLRAAQWRHRHGPFRELLVELIEEPFQVRLIDVAVRGVQLREHLRQMRRHDLPIRRIVREMRIARRMHVTH